MSCDVAVSAAILFASFSPAAQAPAQPLPAVADAPAPGINPLAREPLFAQIVAQAGGLKAQVDGWRTRQGFAPLAGFDDFKAKVAALSDLDMKGHVTLAARGTDGDLKCILKGISQDLPRKLDEVAAAKDAGARKTALDELFYLLRDNIEVITTPPTVHS